MWKCSVDVLNIVMMYMEPYELVNLFLDCGLDFGMKFTYNGFYCELGVPIREIGSVFKMFPGIVLVGLCIENDYTYMRVNNYLDDLTDVPLDINSLVGKIGSVVRGLKHLRIINRSSEMYDKLFDSNVLIMCPNIKTLVLDNLCLRELDGVLYCRGLRRVEMIRCEWKSAKITCFSKLMLLTVVKFGGCSLTHSEARVLIGCRNLKKLEIHNIWPIDVPFAFNKLVHLKIKKWEGHINSLKYRKFNFREISMCSGSKRLSLSINKFVVDCELIKSPLRRLWLKGCEIINVDKLNRDWRMKDS